MNYIVPKYQVINDFPFNKWGIRVPFYPNKSELQVINKFKYNFEDISVLYKVLEESDSSITKVLQLSTGIEFKLGDLVTYKLSYLNYTIVFRIDGFRMDGAYNHNLMVLFKYDEVPFKNYFNKINPLNNLKESKLSSACGIDIISHYDFGLDYGKLKYLNNDKYYKP
jgi:hypothetical protein